MQKDAIFPRIDPKSLDLPKEDAKPEKTKEEKPAAKAEAKKEAKQTAEAPAQAKAEIAYDDFAKLDPAGGRSAGMQQSRKSRQTACNSN